MTIWLYYLLSLSTMSMVLMRAAVGTMTQMTILGMNEVRNQVQAIGGDKVGFQDGHQNNGTDTAGESAVVQAESCMEVHDGGNQARMQKSGQNAGNCTEVTCNLAKGTGKAEAYQNGLRGQMKMENQ